MVTGFVKVSKSKYNQHPVTLQSTMDRQKVFKTTLTIFFVTICAVLFLQNSWQNVGKFISGASMVTRSVKSDQNQLPFPPLSICLNPPFNEKAISENNIDLDPWNYISLNKRDTEGSEIIRGFI